MSEESRRTRLFSPLEKIIRAVIGDEGGTYANEYVLADAQGRIRVNRQFANHLYEVIVSSGTIDEAGSVYKDALMWLVHNSNDPNIQRWAHGVITGQIKKFD